jgi:hypothetical protein
MEVKEEDVKPLAKNKSNKGKLSTRKSSDSRTINTRGSSTKVKEDDFSPRTRRLAIASKNYLRELTAIKSPFPLEDEADREEYVWSLIQETAQNKPIYQPALDMAMKDTNTQMRLVAFVRFFSLSSLTSKIY